MNRQVRLYDSTRDKSDEKSSDNRKWREIKLSEVIERKKRRVKDSKEKKLPVLSISNTDGFTPSEEYFDRKVFSDEISNYKVVKKGEFAYNPARINVGSIALLEHFEEAAISPMYEIFSLKNEVNEKYFQYFTESHRALQFFKRFATGSVRQTLNFSNLSLINFENPPLHEQRKIASVFYNVDQAIQKTEEIIEQTERVKKGVMQDLFTEGYFDHARIVGVEELKTGSGSINTSLDETTIGQIPGSWECKRLEEVTNDSSYGAAESAENFDPEKPRYIRITDISETGLLKSEEKKSLSKKKAKKYLLNPGELLFARSGATVGKTFLYTEENPEAVYGGYLIRFKPDRNIILPKFLFYYTQTKNYRKWVERVTRKGAQENINAREYSSILLPVPPIEEQKKIVDVIDSFYEKEKLGTQFIENLNSLKKGLMQDLLTGEVRTKDKPIDVLPEVKVHG